MPVLLGPGAEADLVLPVGGGEGVDDAGETRGLVGGGGCGRDAGHRVAVEQAVAAHAPVLAVAQRGRHRSARKQDGGLGRLPEPGSLDRLDAVDEPGVRNTRAPVELRQRRSNLTRGQRHRCGSGVRIGVHGRRRDSAAAVRDILHQACGEHARPELGEHATLDEPSDLVDVRVVLPGARRRVRADHVAVPVGEQLVAERADLIRGLVVAPAGPR